MTTSRNHTHEDGLHLQPLPACLTPTDADRTAHPELALPREGDPVVITGGHVMFLWTASGAAPVTEANSLPYGAPMTGGAQWGPDGLAPCDPGPEIDDENAAAIQAAWHLLIDLANQAETGAAIR